MTKETNEMLWTQATAAQIKAAIDIIDGDGHTIFKPAAFIDAGVPKELVDRCTDTYESDFNDHKSTIFVNEKPTNACRGVYGYDMLSSMIRDLGITAPDYMGRGFQARAWTAAINKYIDEQKEPTAV